MPGKRKQVMFAAFVPSRATCTGKLDSIRSTYHKLAQIISVAPGAPGIESAQLYLFELFEIWVKRSNVSLHHAKRLREAMPLDDAARWDAALRAAFPIKN